MQKQDKKRSKLYNKLLVDNIPLYTSCDEIRDHFSKFAELKKVNIPKDKSGGSQGYAFVFFRKKEEMLKTLEMTHRIDGYDLHCEMMKKSDENWWKDSLKKLQRRKIFIRDFDFGEVSPVELRNFLRENYGGVTSLTVNYNPKTKQYDNFVYVYFEEIESAKDILREKKIKIKEKVYIVERFEGSRSLKYKDLRKNGFVGIFRPPIGFSWDRISYMRERFKKIKNLNKEREKKFEGTFQSLWAFSENYELRVGGKKKFWNIEKSKIRYEELKLFAGDCDENSEEKFNFSRF